MVVRLLLISLGLCLATPSRLHSGAPKQAAIKFQRDLERVLEEEDEPEVKAQVEAITPEMYLEELQAITGAASGPDHQRHVSTAGHNMFQQYAACRFQEANFEVKLVDFEASGKTLSNVIGCRAGTTSEKFFLVGAHYDTLPGGDVPSPGAMDNGSGVAVVMLTAKALKDISFEKSVCVAVFDGEELGCLGSRSIAKAIKKNPALSRNFLGAITSDMATGFKPDYKSSVLPGWTKDNSKVLQGAATVSEDVDGIHVDGGPVSRNLIKKFTQAALRTTKQSKTPVLESEKMLWSSDHRSFVEQGFPAIDICSANHREYKYWHNEHNTTQGLDPVIGTEISKTTVSALAGLAKKSTRSLEEEDAPRIHVPAFPRSESVSKRFPKLNCAALLASMSTNDQANDDSKVVSLERIRATASKELTAALDYLEGIVSR